MSAQFIRGACPGLSAPMQTGDGLLVRLQPKDGIAVEAFIALCALARRHGNGMMEVTARGNLQLRGLTSQSAPQLAAAVTDLNIVETCGVPVITNPLTDDRHALLDTGEFGHHQLDMLNGGNTTMLWIVVEVSATAPSKLADSSGQKVRAFVQNERSCRFIKYFQESVNVHQGQVVDRQKVSCAGRMGRPAIHIDVEQRFGGCHHAALLDLNAASPIQLGKLASPAKFDQMWGYIYRQNIAPIYLGEFGTNLSDPKDTPWLQAITAYLGGDFNNDGSGDIAAGQHGPSWTFWAWNPNSGDTGGILASNWTTVNQAKVDYLKPIEFSFDSSAIAPGSNAAVFQLTLSKAATSSAGHLRADPS